MHVSDFMFPSEFSKGKAYKKTRGEPPKSDKVACVFGTFLIIFGWEAHPETPRNRAFQTKVDSGLILMDFSALLGRPRGIPGVPFSALARPGAAREEKKMHKIRLQRHLACI